MIIDFGTCCSHDRQCVGTKATDFAFRLSHRPGSFHFSEGDGQFLGTTLEGKPRGNHPVGFQ